MLSKEKTIAIAVTTLALSLGGIGIAFAENPTPKSNVAVFYTPPMNMSGNMTGFNMTGFNMNGHMGGNMNDYMNDHMGGENSN